MENKKVIIIGSSRSNGNTSKIVSKISSQINADVIDLRDYTISYYDFYLPFRLSANYLGITYLGEKHLSYDTIKDQEYINSIL